MLRVLAILFCLLSGVASAQDDWANLGRFAEANAALGTPGRGEERVVFMGDSITEGWTGASPAYFADNGHINRGIGGQTTPQMLIRFRADVIDLEPKAVVILAGTNDVAGNTGPATNKMIEDNLASMAEIATANGIRVIFSSILPVYDYPWAPGLEPAPRIVEINDWMKQYAEDNDHIYLDYYPAFVDERGGMDARYTTDGVHVNRAGYAIMEARATDAIDEALSHPRSRGNLLEFKPVGGCGTVSGKRHGRDCK